METIKRNDKGAAVEDVQQRLATIGLLGIKSIDGLFGGATANAVRAFCKQAGLPETEEVNDEVWKALVDASFSLGDRTLYLRMPYFHGHDVEELQQALGALGFSCGSDDGIFGAFTEEALRKFQLNMGLFDDGIAGAYTFAAIRNLHHSWEGKEVVHGQTRLGFSRASDVLESNALCLFGTSDFTRSVASRMSNLALATNPGSKIMSADSLLVAPDASMLRVHLVLPDEAAAQTASTAQAAAGASAPQVAYAPEDTLPLRLGSAIAAARAAQSPRVTLQLPGTMWQDAGEDRSAQHFAITLLDALCTALG